MRMLVGAAFSAILTTAALAGVMGSAGPASAAMVGGSPDATTTVPGGMVHASSGAVPGPASAGPAAAYPRCTHIVYTGNAGFIAVQESNHRLQWGITMTPLTYSVGTWNVSTYLSGSKTSSGFNRTVTTGYIPHGSLSVPANKVFHVSAKVVGPNGTFVNVPNACLT
jgi:hypothetical protein